MRKESVRFESYELESNGFVRPSAVLRRMQQIARDDLDSFGISYEDLRNRNMAFVVSKMALVFQRPVEGEIPLQLASAAMATHGVTFPRAFVLSDEKGPILHAMSLWALLDFEKRTILRPSALGEEIPVFEDLSEGVTCARLIRPQDTAPERTDVRKVYPSLLDQNCHLNNCHYADLATDLYPDSPSVREMHLTYQTEALLGDELLMEGFDTTEGRLVAGKNLTRETLCFLCRVKTF